MDITQKKDHKLGVLVKILQPKKQIRYKCQIRDIFYVYLNRYNVIKCRTNYKI